MRKHFGLIILLAGILTFAGITTGKAADAFPKGKMTFLIGNAPGGGNDLLVRALLPGMSAFLGQEVMPEILQGANGGVAAVKLGTMKPDGHTLYLHSQSLVMMQYTGQPQVNIKKYRPVAQVAEDFGALVVPVNSPFNSIADLVTYAKANPGKVKLGTTSAGIWPINVTLFEEKANIKLKVIPYSSGGAAAGTAAAAGEVDVALDSPIVYRSLVEGGKLKMIGVFGANRSSIFPNVPTVKEQGIDVVFPVWRAVFTTAGVPEAILAKLSDAIKAALATEQFKTYITASGLPVRFRDYKEVEPFMAAEDTFYKTMLTKMGLKTSEPK